MIETSNDYLNKVILVLNVIVVDVVVVDVIEGRLMMRVVLLV